jgi:two-component system, OmpR family, alkaline phosphatase synthesis response regulator PhoP
LSGRVLVVDDESIIRTFLAEGLSDAGYQVLIARDGAEALDSVHRFHPDAVLLDLLMPVMDGWAFLRERRVQPALAAVPVVVFSAAGREGLHDASALRATAVLPKPLNLDVLSAVLEHVLSDARKDRPTGAATLAGEAAAAGRATDAGAAAEAANAGRAAAAAAGRLEADAGAGPSAARRVGNCPICGIALYAHIDDALPVPARIRAIHAVRRKHVLSHTAGDIARVPLRTRLLQMPIGQRRILADWVYSELRHQWGDADRLGVHSIDEALDSVAMHRLWQDAARCAYSSCPHGD